MEDFVAAIARIERLGKGLFGVSACVVQLEFENDADAALFSPSEAHRFCAQLPLGETLQIMPQTSAPFQAALGKIGNVEVRFYAVQALRDYTGKVVGRVGLVHERMRAFTAGDKLWLEDLVALIERELHLYTCSKT